MRIFRNSCLFLFTALLFSCGKIVTLPPEPSISFTSFEVFDTTDILGNESKGGRLKFHFEDGDGDLGLEYPTVGSDSDTTNLFMSLYRKSDGIVIPAPEDDPLTPSNYRIPYMERTGQNKILKGTISVTLIYFFYSETDTIKYEFYIKDRAGNVSNSVFTSEIALGSNNIYYPDN